MTKSSAKSWKMMNGTTLVTGLVFIRSCYRQARIRMEQELQTKEFIEHFIRERAKWKEEEAKRIEEENRKILEYAKKQEQKEEARKEALREAADARNAIYEKLKQEMESKEKHKQELEDLRIELYAQEEEERLKRVELINFEKRVRQRLELLDAYRQQSEDKRQRLQKEMEEEEKFRAKVSSSSVCIMHNPRIIHRCYKSTQKNRGWSSLTIKSVV